MSNYPDELCKCPWNLYLFLPYYILSNSFKNSATYKYKQGIVCPVQHLYTQMDPDHASRRTTYVMHQSFEIPAPPPPPRDYQRQRRGNHLVFTTLTFPYSKEIHTFSLRRCLEQGESRSFTIIQ